MFLETTNHKVICNTFSQSNVSLNGCPAPRLSFIFMVGLEDL